ncbi:hypothetical protein JL720_5317 [Aureococcus anophagefferens]|nr:hypothetical protein JL720_5317 [Aureococcus anophagefferens]
MSALESSQEEDLGAMAAAAARANLVFCSSSPVLIAAQTHHLYDDCKTFVDSPMRVDPEEILEKFKAVDAADEAAVRSFVVKHFDLPSGELATAGPPGGWTAAPAVLGELGDARDVAWARALNDLWRQLARKAAPGADRCRSYWIVEGLLVCDCYGAAKDMILNLLDYVEAFGFVRAAAPYYLNRSQPPLLSDMVTVNGATYTLLCYRTAATLPRAESYREDLATAARAPEARRAAIYGDLAAAAESGWDFSSRWLGEPDRLETIETSRVVPADLNAIFVRFERNLAALHRFVGGGDGKAPLRVAWARAKENAMEPPGERFVPGARFAPRRAEAIGACLAAAPRARRRARRRRRAVAPEGPGPALSDYFPLWAGVADDWKLRDQVQLVSSLVTSGLLSDGGAATTALNTGEQWDAPNAWPPLQFVLDAGLRRLEPAVAGASRATSGPESCASPRPEARAARFGESTICPLGERDDRPRDDDRGYANGGGYEDRGGGGGGGKSRGTALRWNERGFGFIKPDDGGDDLFCHLSQILDGNALREGSSVEYMKVFDERRGKDRAEQVSTTASWGRTSRLDKSSAADTPEVLARAFDLLGALVVVVANRGASAPEPELAPRAARLDGGTTPSARRAMASTASAATQRHVGLHPLAIVGVSDHFTRVKLGGARVAPDSPVLGLLFGKQVGLDVAVFDAIELSMADGKLDHDFLKKQAELFTDVYADRELLGWYCLAKSATPAHLDLHREFLAYNESPLCLMMDPEPSAESKDLPITILEAEVQVVDDVPTMLFATLPFTLETLQAERISMEIVAKTAPTDGESALDTHVEAVDTSLRTLGSRVAVLVDYLRAVAGGKAEPDFALLRQVSGLCDTLPTGGAPDQTRDLMRDYNDALMVSYLASVTKRTP